MKSIAIFALAAAFSVTAASAKTVTIPQKNANEQAVNAVAGPSPVRHAESDKSSTQPSKKVLRKSRITPPPPLHDPN
jgi:hypothetical protein